VVKHLVIPIIDHETCEEIYSNVTSETTAQKEECDEPLSDTGSEDIEEDEVRETEDVRRHMTSER